VEKKWKQREYREVDDSPSTEEKPQEQTSMSDISSRIAKVIERHESTEQEGVEKRIVEQRVRAVVTRSRIKEVVQRHEPASEESEPEEQEFAKNEIKSRIQDVIERQSRELSDEKEPSTESDTEEKLATIQKELDSLKEDGIDVTNVDSALRELYREMGIAENNEHSDDETIEKILPDKETRIDEFSNQELRYAYEKEHGRNPEVTIESMEKVDELIKKHETSLDMRYVTKNYEQCKKYMAIHNDWTKTQKELGEEHDISQSLVGKWRSRYEHGLVRTLRSLEEDFIVQKWAETQEKERVSEVVREYTESIEETAIEPLRQDFSEAKKIGSKSIEESLNRITEAQKKHEHLVEGFEKMHQEGTGNERIFYSDITSIHKVDEIKSIEDVLNDKKELIESELHRRLSLEGTEKAVKVAMIEGRLYMWIQDQSKNDMLNAWANQYFYPKDSREFSRLSDTTLDKLELYPRKPESKEHYNKIMDHMLSKGDSEKIRKSKHLNDTRIQGESLRFQMDVNGVDTTYLNDRIERITGVNGQGGVRHPRFIEGKQLEHLRARLMATVNSDFHLRPDGRGEYYEESWERIEIFKQNLSELGEMNVTVVKRKGDFKANITSAIGNPMIFWGCPFGDKSIRNQGLPKEFMNLSEDTHQKYGEDLIVQDGAVTKNGQVTWVRHVAIHAGDKTEEYGFQTSISKSETDLIQSEGVYDECMDRHVLGCSSLERLTRSKITEIAEPARVIQQAIGDNPSNMMETEAEIFRSQGIAVTTKATAVKYYMKTGKVSVSWVAKTETIEDAVKWLKSCPPNDVVKREKAYDILEARGEQPQWSKKNPSMVSSQE
jgi:hypothetical protein